MRSARAAALPHDDVRPLSVAQVTEPREWDQALLALPNPHILQSWAWGEFKSCTGWRARRLLFQDQGQRVAAATVLERKVPRLPLTILYVPKGPALDWAAAGLADRVLAELERLACRRRALFIKVDADIYHPADVPLFSPRPACAPELTGALSARGWRFSAEQIQYRNTALLDLSLDQDDLLVSMKQKSRYNVRLAQRRGVTVREGTLLDVDLFYRLYAETAQRDGFLIRPRSYYADAWERFMDRGQGDAASARARLLLAEFEGEVVAGLLLFIFGPTAWYMYGASSDRHRQHMPNHLLQWEAMRWAKAAGCTLYDLWGAPDRLDEADPMWGVLQFKLGLGGQVARGIGAWDFPTRRLLYHLYGLAVPRYLGWLRGRDRAWGARPS